MGQPKAERTLRSFIEEVMKTGEWLTVHQIASRVNQKTNLGYTETRRRCHQMLTRMARVGQLEKRPATSPPSGGGRHPCFEWKMT